MVNKYAVRTQTIPGCNFPAYIDVYCVLEAFGVTCPATQHAVKKLLKAGMRGHKDALQDLQEAKASIERAIQMCEERGKENSDG